MLTRGLKVELRWLTLVVLASVIVGYSFDMILACLVCSLSAFIFWLLYRISALEAWVSIARRREPPADDFGGVWGEIADDVRLLCKRYEKDKIRLQAVVTRVQDMTSALTDGVVLVDNRANIEWWNRASQLLFDFRDMDRGHKLVNIIRNPRFIAYFEKQDYQKPLEMMSPLSDNKHLELNVHPFGQGERLVVIRDVTRMKRLEQMRKDFVSNVSHELRTPLTVIKGYIETLLDSPNISPTWQGALKQMHSQSNRMTALVNDLIVLTRLETSDSQSSPSPVQIAPMLQMIISDAKSVAIDSEHRITVDCPSELALIGKEAELRSIFSNLVFNAIKYSPNGGDILIKAQVQANSCVISIKDHGLGIDPKHIPRLTERFYRVDEGRNSSMGGTGLGLAIVKHSLARHDADLKIESRLEFGSTFSCHFPLSRVINKNAPKLEAC